MIIFDFNKRLDGATEFDTDLGLFLLRHNEEVLKFDESSQTYGHINHDVWQPEVEQLKSKLSWKIQTQRCE